ncbi:holin [Oenococcus sicerae]|uniref:Holin n=1 Tax=Oenococcus sicerae TaxID=2203724 RepID=A0AAJ1VMW0_9LACO|nr:holin [Oenococcus sicerae]MDN6899584.1 holin [Oenococcus sicerae]
MDVQNISDLVIAIAVAAVPAIGAYIVKILKANKFVAILGPLAHDAVVAAQKLGVVSYLEGEAKKSKAVEFVISALAKLGFKKADLTTIQNAVEDEYAKAIASLDVTYPQMTEVQEQATQSAMAAKVKADALAVAKQAVIDAQAKVAELSK